MIHAFLAREVYGKWVEDSMPQIILRFPGMLLGTCGPAGGD